MRSRSLLLAALLGLSPCLAAADDAPVITYPAGTYTVTTPGATQVDHGPGYVTFRWGGVVPPMPPPVPPPVPPAPPPTPTPALTGKLYVSYIMPDPSTQPQVALKAALVAGAKALDANLACRTYLESEAEPARLSLIPEGKKPPFIVIQHQAAGAAATDPAPIVKTIDDPKSLDEVKAAVAKLRGN